MSFPEDNFVFYKFPIYNLFRKYPGMLKAALGIYPTDAANMCEEEVEEAIDFIEKNAGKIAAIGECGLDYHHLTDMNDPQKNVFRKLK